MCTVLSSLYNNFLHSSEVQLLTLHVYFQVFQTSFTIRRSRCHIPSCCRLIIFYFLFLANGLSTCVHLQICLIIAPGIYSNKNRFNQAFNGLATRQCRSIFGTLTYIHSISSDNFEILFLLPYFSFHHNFFLHEFAL